MGSQRAYIVLPQELIEEIDSVVGPRGRSAFLVETARTELRRRRLLSFLRGDQAAWKDKDHPELDRGTESWVKQIRRQSEARVPAARRSKKSTR